MWFRPVVRYPTGVVKLKERSTVQGGCRGNRWVFTEQVEEIDLGYAILGLRYDHGKDLAREREAA